MAANQKRQQKPRLFIRQGGGTSFDSICLLCNMGNESVYLRGVFIDIQTVEGEQQTAIAEKEWKGGAEASTADDIAQGPIASSQQMSMGSFRQLLQEACRKAGLIKGKTVSEDALFWQRLESFTVTAIVTVGPYEKTVGATRSFQIDQSNQQLTSKSASTFLRSSRRDVKALGRYLSRYIDEDA
ncbi:hypothetical protein [Salinisphaera aquimarina]|uniref:Uncharacterized protein n=1 Tax=Salinisphaera aquimarina TaxID=2094031 RepID=A0ABV7ET05_9GAMM